MGFLFGKKAVGDTRLEQQIVEQIRIALQIKKDGKEIVLVGKQSVLEEYIASYPNGNSDGITIYESETGSFLLDCCNVHYRSENGALVARLLRYTNSVVMQPKEQFEAMVEELKSKEGSDNVLLNYFYLLIEDSYGSYDIANSLIESFGKFGESDVATNLKDLDLRKQVKNQQKYLSNVKANFEKELEGCTDPERKDYLEKIIKDLEDVLNNPNNEVFEGARETVNGWRKMENNYEVGIIGCFEKFNHIDYSGIFCSDGTRFVMADDKSILQLIQFAIDIAKDNGFYVKKCAQCDSYIYTSNTRFPVFCGEDCRKEYRLEYDKGHAKLYKKYKPANNTYDNLCRLMRRHIEKQEDIELKEKMQQAYEQFKSDAKAKKKKANQSGKIYEFASWCWEVQDDFIALEKDGD